MNKSTEKIYKLLGLIVPIFVLVLLVSFLPVVFLPLYTVKVTLFLFFSIVILVLVLMSLFSSGIIEIPKARFLIPLALLPIVAIVSSIFNGFALSFAGTMFERHTSVVALALSVTSLVIAFVPFSKRVLIKTFYAISFATLISAVLLVLKVLFGNLNLLAKLFYYIPDVLVGSVTDLAIMLGASSIVILNFLYAGKLYGKLRLVSICIIAFTVLFLATIGFKPTIYLFMVFSIAHFFYGASMNKRVSVVDDDVYKADNSNPNQNVKMPKHSLVLAGVMLVVLIGGSGLSSFLSSKFGISNLDVRPNFSSSLDITGESLKNSPILGAGPNNFMNLWSMYKPVEVNNTNFWSLDFSSGFSYFMTFFAETGLLGIVLGAGFIITLFMIGFYAVFSQNVDSENRFILSSVFFLVAYLILTSLVYDPGIVVLVVTFIFVGIFASSLSMAGVVGVKRIELFKNSRSNFISVFVISILIIATASSTYFVWQMVSASRYETKGLVKISSGDINGSLADLLQAAQSTNSDEYWRALSETFLAKAKIDITKIDPNNISENQKAEIQAAVGNAILAARNAVVRDPSNYLNHLVLGRVYELLASIKVDGAANLSAESYKNAQKNNPNNPGLSLVLARLAMMENKADEATKYIDESLKLKPNFTEGHFLKAQIESLKGNISAVIRSVENAVITDPYNSGLYFQLGLLKYQNKDFAGAAGALEKAVLLIPDYANAKYFLGLAYYELDKNKEAVAQFEDLKKTNPDNIEVASILSNLRAEMAPFANAKQADKMPEKRKELPVKDRN